jgi:hypothetical protein
MSQDPIWDEVWNANYWLKLKYLLENISMLLSHTAPLANWHAITNSSCPLCVGACEDIKHTLFLCGRANEVWEKLRLWRLVEEACAIDRARSVVFEYLIY